MSPSSLQPTTAQLNNVETQSIRPVETDKDLPSSILKAIRAFEHNRQRTKRAEDHVRAKAKKERSKALPESVKSTGGAGGKAARKSRSRGVWDDADTPAALDGENSISPLPKSWASSARRPETTEVKLADLISTKTKPPKSKAADSDFEFIPHMPSVIVLDDTFLIEDSNGGPDEPWEHILGVEDEDAKANAPSYAQVVSKSQ
ncbi:hypothetical protein OE88DRAFT_1803556 [Heliocybe sulcata]|uniref:Uncharacterized protein n=1 Tax=Heliocybe sulcata TaxID=5364 RepID=A0A5C3NGQ8_9AGAM|nr:hypothetical protein OE88DRAFT_1803556 [Heliocybe sulcata]